jgi:glycosyltransferase involved in cell wall biosynthesis
VLERAGEAPLRFIVDEDSTPQSWQAFADRHQVEAAIGLHGFHSGRVLIGSPVPYALVFCNTDIHRDLHLPDRRDIVLQAGQEAAVLSSYDEHLSEVLFELFPKQAPKAVCLGKAVYAEGEEHSFHETLGLSESAQLFVVPSGIRAIKDPLYAASQFEKLASEFSDIHLLIIGAVRDVGYAEYFFDEIQRFSKVHYLEPVERELFLGGLSRCTAAICTSEFEGIPNALLEAMVLGVPVIIRAVLGAKEMVEHNESGLLFDTPEQCAACVRRLLQEDGLRERLSLGAQKRIAESFSQEKELHQMTRLLKVLSHAHSVEPSSEC